MPFIALARHLFLFLTHRIAAYIHIERTAFAGTCWLFKHLSHFAVMTFPPSITHVANMLVKHAALAERQFPAS